MDVPKGVDAALVVAAAGAAVVELEAPKGEAPLVGEDAAGLLPKVPEAVDVPKGVGAALVVAAAGAAVVELEAPKGEAPLVGEDAAGLLPKVPEAVDVPKGVGVALVFTTGGTSAVTVGVVCDRPNGEVDTGGAATGLAVE